MWRLLTGHIFSQITSANQSKLIKLFDFKKYTVHTEDFNNLKHAFNEKCDAK